MNTILTLALAALTLTAFAGDGDWSPGRIDKKNLKSRLSKLQYDVTQKDATERPFKNKYWDNKQEGIYVDVVSGEPLFSSKDKFKSGTGWPSFTRPIESDHIVERADKGLWYTRIEIRSKYADSHLGHVFDDGPKPTGKRFCMNSAALRFVPVEDLKKEGYGKYEKEFGISKSAQSGAPAKKENKKKAAEEK